jgi:hypothetical protein
VDCIVPYEWWRDDPGTGAGSPVSDAPPARRNEIDEERSWPVVSDSGTGAEADTDEVRFRDNSASGAYEAVVGETVIGSIKYWPHGHRIVFGHTAVNEPYRGKGIAAGLVRSALDDIVAKQFTLTNYCPFVARYIARHPSYRTLIDPDRPGPAVVPAEPHA